MVIVKNFHSKDTNMLVHNLLYHVAMMREQEYHPTELHATQDEKGLYVQIVYAHGKLQTVEV